MSVSRPASTSPSGTMPARGGGVLLNVLILAVTAAICGSVLFGAPGVLIGQAAAGVLFGGFAWVLALRMIANGGQPKGPRPEVFGREGRLMSLLHLRR